MNTQSKDMAGDFPAQGDARTTDSAAYFCPSCGAGSESRTNEDTSVCEQCLLGLGLDFGDQAGGCDEALPRKTQFSLVLGPYSLAEEIGRGGMGVIYRAVHHETGETVALKTVLPEHTKCAETLIRFQREAETAQRLVHPHSMPIHEVGCSSEGVPFFSMKLASGGSLRELRAKYQGRWRQIAELMVKISRAVHHAHRQGVLHRDLKPGNILFSEDHEPLITDFGLAKCLNDSDDLTQSCAVLGTPSYASPEQATGKTRDVTPAADIYSLGAILYELLTGQPPFAGDNPLEVLRKVAEEIPRRPRQLLPSIPIALEAICLRCLERSPQDRYDSAKSLADDFELWLQEGRISHRPASTWIRKCLERSFFLLGWRGQLIGLAAVLCWGYLMVSRNGSNPRAMTAIAVAIEDFDQDPSVETVMQEATDNLKHYLSQTQTFQVQDAGPNRSNFIAEPFDPLGYGRLSNAQTILTGCVRRSGTQVRLAMRLLRCDTGETVWRRVDTLSADHVETTLPSVARDAVKALQASWFRKSQAVFRSPRLSTSLDAQTLYTRAMELAARTNQRDLSDAVKLFQRACELDPQLVMARSMLAFAFWTQADTYGETDKLPSALSAAREALALDPDSAQAHRVVAACYFKDVRYKEASEEFWNAVELNPRSAGCCVSLGICLREMGHPAQAMPWLLRAIDLEPTQGALRATLSETLILCGREEQGELALKHAIALDGDQSELQIDLSALRCWQNRFDDARKLCAETRLRFPESRFGMDLAAWIELCDGKKPEATSYFEQLRVKHSYERDWEFYGAVNPSSALAYIAGQSGLNERAHLLAEEALKIDKGLLERYPNNARVLHDLAATFSVVGETEQSLDYLRQSITAGWVECCSTKIDPRFAAVVKLPRFKLLLEKVAQQVPADLIQEQAAKTNESKGIDRAKRDQK